MYIRKTTEQDFDRVMAIHASARAFMAAGGNPRQWGATGWPPAELIRPLSNFEKVCSQGINGPTWALIALDSGGYNMQVDGTAKTVATRQMYVDEILSRIAK